MNGSLFVIAGEISGDVHAAGLLTSLRELRPGLKIKGAGGSAMQKIAGDGVRDWLDRSAVMGVVEVLKHYRWFKDQFDRLLSEVEQMQPEVLLLVDYPGFNFRFAAAVRERMPEVKIVQYVCPQVWAWKKRRIKRMPRLFDEVLCLLPFEAKLFENSPLKATFVGHPLIDELEAGRIDIDRQQRLIALLPGSREPEIKKLFPMMLETAERLLIDDSSLQFQAPAATPRLEELMSSMLAARNLSDHVRISAGGAHRLMQQAHCGVVASGTATLEAAFFGMPYCLVYRLAWPTYLIAKLVVKIERIGLINILAERDVVEELIQSEAEAITVSRSIKRFIDDHDYAEKVRAELLETCKLLGGEGAHQRAAQAVNKWFD